MKAIIITFFIIGLVLVTAACVAGTKLDVKDTDEQRIVKEIYPQYEWEKYAYKIEELTFPQGEHRYYVATFYTDQGKYEFLVEVDGDDVDEELIEVTK